MAVKRIKKMKNNLIIGNTSQLSYFFPDDYIKISSRNIDENYIKNNEWGSVYLTFAEQRINDNVDCMNINYDYTINILENLIDNSEKIVVYTTCELWNKYIGEVSLNDQPDWSWPNSNGYCLSKDMLMKHINKYRSCDKWRNVIIIHPFNFNSTYRRSDFLFGQIFESIINKKKIEIGNTYFYRDIIHTKYVVERSIKADKDEMVGSGRLYFINDFIRDLYKSFGMKYEDYVKEDRCENNRHSDKLYYSYKEKPYTYDMLLKDTIDDIEKRIKLKDG